MRDLRDYGFTRFSVPSEVEAFEDACYQAGRGWAKTGNKKLPRIASVDGKQVPILQSISLNSRAFVQGWKDGGRGQ